MTFSRSCPVCQASLEKAKLFLDKNINVAKLSGFSFSSRKEPEHMCHRLMLCTVCDLVFADQPPEQAELSLAYHLADYDSSEEASEAALAYLSAIGPTLNSLGRHESVLEIGTGTGVFLEHLAQSGFTRLTGIEPSALAIAAAPEHRRGWIREGIFDETEFPPASYDLICCFMTMEHVLDPAEISRAAFRLLRNGGAFVTVTHDYRSFVNRVMGRWSPIIDIEHLQLFSERSVRQLFNNTGFKDVTVSAFANAYALRYWIRLLPLPRTLKAVFTEVTGALGIGDAQLSINVGNFITAGFKRA